MVIIMSLEFVATFWFLKSDAWPLTFRQLGKTPVSCKPAKDKHIGMVIGRR